MRKRKFWYRIHWDACYVCGGGSFKGRSWRERVYGRKPKSIKKRWIFETAYCGCMDYEFL